MQIIRQTVRIRIRSEFLSSLICVISVCNFLQQMVNVVLTVLQAKSDSGVIFFSIVKLNINLYTPLELTRIDKSLVY